MPASVAADATPCFVALDDVGLLALEGARVITFLQGQLTCDLREASAIQALAGAWCTPKGRVICSLMAWPETPDRVLLRMHADLLSSTAEQLTRYAALSRVGIRPAGLCCIGLLGLAHADAKELGLPRPEGKGAVTAMDDGAVLCADSAGARHELWIRQEARDAWLQRLRGPLQEGCPNDWRLALVREGVAEVRASTRELFLPQMLGYDSDGRVSFRKGCYTGQEIVARAHYKGGVKRHLHRLLGEGQPPAPGSLLERSGTNVGTVVESARVGQGACEVLAVVADESGAAPGAPCLCGGLELHLPA